MQGQLCGKYISGLIETSCAHCQKPLHIEIDSDLKYRVVEEDARPLFFAPLQTVQPGAPSIIDGF